jgi:hypothetical protein
MPRDNERQPIIEKKGERNGREFLNDTWKDVGVTVYTTSLQ